MFCVWVHILRYHEMSISIGCALNVWMVDIDVHWCSWRIRCFSVVWVFNHHDWLETGRICSVGVISLKRKLYLSSLFQHQTNNTKNSVVSAVVNAMKESNTASSTPMVPHLCVTHLLIWPYPIAHVQVFAVVFGAWQKSFETVLHVLKISDL